MDLKTVQGAIRWLLEAKDKNGHGWGRWPSDSPSVTITAEVVMALQRIPPAMLPQVEEQAVQDAIDKALNYIEETLPKRQEADLPNFAYGSVAHLRANAAPNPAFLGFCLKGILAFHEPMRGWKARTIASRPSIFATCLAMLALHDFLFTPHGIKFLATDQGLRTQARLAYTQAIDYLFASGSLDVNDGWRDRESSDDASHLAITALILYARTRHLQALGATELMTDKISKQAIEYLYQHAPTSVSEWTYGLRESDYQLYYVPYIVLALSDHLDWLTQSQLEFYYRTVSLLAGPAMRHTYNGELREWFINPRDKASPVWAAAHALRGILSVSLTGREISFFNQMIAERDGQKHEYEALAGRPASLLAEPHIQLGIKGCWIQLSEIALSVLSFLLAIALAVIYLLYPYKTPSVKVASVVIELLLLCTAIYPATPRKENFFYRLMIASSIAFAIISFVAILLGLLSSNASQVQP